jgi:hypothetical protein
METSSTLNRVYSLSDLNNAEQIVEEQMAMSELKKIYWHERELLIAIPLLLRTACTFELVESLTMLSQYTRNHVEQLENNFPSIAKVA